MRLGAGREGRDIGEGLAVIGLPLMMAQKLGGVMGPSSMGGVSLARFDIRLKGFTRPYLIGRVDND